MRALRFPFSVSMYGQVVDTSDYSQIVRGQIIDALMTNFGERVFRPRYGSDIQSALFDPSDELVRRDAAGQVQKRLEQLVPRAIIRGVAVHIDVPETGHVTIDVSYRSSPYGTDASIAVPIASEFFNRQSAPIPLGEI